MCILSIICQKVKTNMSEDFRRFEEFMNRMLDEFGGGIWNMPMRRSLPESLTVKTHRQPYIDIVETDKEIVATAEMPGLNKEDIHINLTNDRLELSTETKNEEEKKGKDYIYRERRSGSYYRMVSLPSSIDVSNAKASYNNGILEIKMPKIEVKKKTSVNVE
jgi:HSP20 family protein